MTSHSLAHPGDDNPVPIDERGPASRAIITAYGFWIFLLSDFVLFAGFFAAYAVQHGATAGGPGGKQIFELPLVAAETALLLASSFASGLATVAMMVKRLAWFEGAMAVTGLLGAGFLALEISEFAHLIGAGNGPGRSGFLSAFFALVGCHGLHVTLGLIWLTTMMAQVRAKGFRDDIKRRVACFMLFWHALDILWVAIFTTVYLLGTLA